MPISSGSQQIPSLSQELAHLIRQGLPEGVSTLRLLDSQPLCAPRVWVEVPHPRAGLMHHGERVPEGAKRLVAEFSATQRVGVAWVSWEACLLRWALNHVEDIHAALVHAEAAGVLPPPDPTLEDCGDC